MDEYRPAETFDQSKRSKNTFVNGLLAVPTTPGQEIFVLSSGFDARKSKD